jgi:DNA processing protein
VLAALTQATVVVEAPIKSGARSTARHARRLGRPLFVVPASPWDPRAAGNLAEVCLGGRLLAREEPLFTLLGVPAPAAAAVRENPPKAAGSARVARTPAAKMAKNPSTSTGTRFPASELSTTCLAVFRATSSTPRHSDDLCSRTGLPAALVQEALLTLTLHAVLVEGPASWFRRVSG